MDADELRRLGYSETDIAGFEEFGGYLGWRAAVTQDATGTWTWTVFVAGD